MYRVPTSGHVQYLFNLDLTVQTPPDKLLQLGSHCTGTPQTNLFNLDLTVQGPPNKLFKLGPQCAGSPALDMFKLVHYEACTVVKLDAGILLECFLVVVNIKRQVLEHRFEYLYFYYTTSPTCNVPLFLQEDVVSTKCYRVIGQQVIGGRLH